MCDPQTCVMVVPHTQLIKTLNATEENEDKFALVVTCCAQRLFKCEHIIKILETTPSVRTRMAMAEVLAAHAFDPTVRCALMCMLVV